jgi:hypothetical protein
LEPQISLSNPWSKGQLSGGSFLPTQCRDNLSSPSKRKERGHPSSGETFSQQIQYRTDIFQYNLLLNNSDIIGTSRNAILTANALIFVNQNHPILSFMRGSSGADSFAFGAITALLCLDNSDDIVN